MFFMRLRRGTKPMFIFLALVFAASFVLLGVGSGSSGIGDLLRGNFNLFGGSSGPSISTDDPAMFDTNLSRDYEAARALGLEPRRAFEAGVAGALQEEPFKAKLREIGERFDWSANGADSAVP